MEGFTFEEVEEILPEIAFLVEEAMAVNQELKEVYSRAFKIKSEIDVGEEKLISHNFTKENKKKIKILAEEVNDIIEEIEESGVIFKDVDAGIVDFPSQFQGKDICFCWKIGEKKVKYWHEEEEGFTSRKKILRLGE